jgi:chorismate-pyruvate lyase
VTELLEQLAGEPIVADKLLQEHMVARTAGVPDNAGASRVRRVVVLRGRHSQRKFVYAEALLDIEHIPPEIVTGLATTDAPLGHLLAHNDVDVLRVQLPSVPPAPLVTDGELAHLIEEASLSRSYRLHVDGEPAIEIDEWFLPAVEEALRQRASIAGDRDRDS